MKKLFLLSIMIVLLNISCSAKKRDIDLKGAKIGKWTMDYNAALKAGKKYDKPIFLQFTGSDWCPWCKLMAKNVFATAVWKKYAKKNLFLVYLNFPRYDLSLVPKKYRERNNLLVQQYGVQGFPTYIILDSDGKTILGKLGAGRDKTGVSFVKEVKRVVRTRPSEYKKLLKKLSPGTRKKLETLMEKKEKIINDLRAWINTRPQKTDKNIKIYNNYIKKITKLEKEIDAIFDKKK